jgi:hypothetical protein
MRAVTKSLTSRTVVVISPSTTEDVDVGRRSGSLVVVSETSGIGMSTRQKLRKAVGCNAVTAVAIAPRVSRICSRRSLILGTSRVRRHKHHPSPWAQLTYSRADSRHASTRTGHARRV